MIPKGSITAWRKIAPWSEDWQIEQDLIVSRALVDLFNRPKIGGRDLFDLDLALNHSEFDVDPLLEAFDEYMKFGGTPVTRAQFEANMAAKITDAPFLSDVSPILRTGVDHNPVEAWSRVHSALVSRLSGDPWKGDSNAG